MHQPWPAHPGPCLNPIGPTHLSNVGQVVVRRQVVRGAGAVARHHLVEHRAAAVLGGHQQQRGARRGGARGHVRQLRGAQVPSGLRER